MLKSTLNTGNYIICFWELLFVGKVELGRFNVCHCSWRAHLALTMRYLRCLKWIHHLVGLAKRCHLSTVCVLLHIHCCQVCSCDTSSCTYCRNNTHMLLIGVFCVFVIASGWYRFTFNTNIISIPICYNRVDRLSRLWLRYVLLALICCFHDLYFILEDYNFTMHLINLPFNTSLKLIKSRPKWPHWIIKPTYKLN